jgi:uncharacterized membrane protein
VADFPIDITTLAAILGMAGIMTTIIFQVRSFRKEQREKQQADKEQIMREINEKVKAKLEVITVTTSGLEKSLEEFKNVNREDLINLKQELKELALEVKQIDHANSAKREELESKIMSMYTRITDLEIKLERK